MSVDELFLYLKMTWHCLKGDLADGSGLSASRKPELDSCQVYTISRLLEERPDVCRSDQTFGGLQQLKPSRAASRILGVCKDILCGSIPMQLMIVDSNEHLARY
jgi:hypothetical protein